MADALTIEEVLGSIEGKKVVYVGDGNKYACEACARMSPHGRASTHTRICIMLNGLAQSP